MKPASTKPQLQQIDPADLEKVSGGVVYTAWTTWPNSPPPVGYTTPPNTCYQGHSSWPACKPTSNDVTYGYNYGYEAW